MFDRNIIKLTGEGKRYGSATNEYRAFYINHEVATLCRNSNQSIYVPLPPEELVNKYKDIDSVP